MTTQTDGASLELGAQARVSRALDAAFARAIGEHPSTARASLDLSSGRYAFFSDLHRGARNGADDFWRCERAYNAAIAFYNSLRYTLVVAGDVEELWEERPGPVLEAYERTFRLEAQFHQDGRYFRIRGNHDDEWQYESSVKRHLVPVYGPPELQVYESLLLTVTDGGAEPLGSVFALHGQQGSTTSDRMAGVAKYVVRYLWRPIQRMTGWSLNTPQVSWELRQRDNRMLYAWAADKPKLILIAGHTHRPVFKSASHEAQLQDELANARAKADDPPSPRQLEHMAELLAEIEWVAAQEKQRPRSEAKSPAGRKPCYFNTGCCAYLDGDVTGLEISEGQIRLVRWPDDNGDPKRKILAHGSLRAVLAAC